MSTTSPSWGKRPHRLLAMGEAWEVVRNGVLESAMGGFHGTPKVGIETVPIGECIGRVLACPVITDDDYPAFDKSMMDGFAVRSADCAAAGSRLKICGLIVAGRTTNTTIGCGEAMQINTGAAIPSGADAVVRIEDCEVDADSVVLRVAVAQGKNASRQGSDRRRGDVVLTPPLRIGAAQIAAAATAGAATLEVANQVQVALVSTGDELVRAGETRRFGQIYDSNGPMLSAMMREFGASPRPPSSAPDELEALIATLRNAMECPIVLTVGGMSMGTHDLVPQAFESLGVKWRFHGVSMRPGKPMAYGVGPDGQQVFGLPGNPVSAFVCAWLFVRMAIRGLQGFEPLPPRTVRVTLAEEIKAHRDSRPAYVPAKVWSDEARGLLAAPTKWSGSSDPFGLAEANALLCLLNPDTAAPAGSGVEVIPTTGGFD
ncbi:MAG: molybdopterin molybdotransferase MoeA [Planctomycetia bacterium]|nr:molybdopterin molybdotransferase MoeA [Planctomycetia bacterium]MCC7313255.1 molybdopterin molybdotransferase MoeA [Planctomycetota bacterium]